MRQQVADKFPTLQKSLLAKLKTNDVETVLVETYCNLVKDVESEVRQKAVVHFGTVCSQFTQGNRKQICTEHMLPILKNLVSDQMSQVKSNLGGALVDCARILGKDLANKEILPLVMLQLKDETAEVRMNVISNLTKFDELIGMDSITKQVQKDVIKRGNGVFGENLVYLIIFTTLNHASGKLLIVLSKYYQRIHQSHLSISILLSLNSYFYPTSLSNRHHQSRKCYTSQFH